jgi:hypothetical protein
MLPSGWSSLFVIIIVILHCLSFSSVVSRTIVASGHWLSSLDALCFVLSFSTVIYTYIGILAFGSSLFKVLVLWPVVE